MQITLKPAMKRTLPLVVAAMSLLPLAANTTKNETRVQKPIVPEYLQADMYEKKGDERINAGLTQEEAYKNAATKAKFDEANHNNDYEISEEEATIYNWGGKNVFPNYWSVQPSGLVLWSRDMEGAGRNTCPEYAIYPTQIYSESMFEEQKALFTETDRNKNKVLSATECLRQIKAIELENINERIAAANSKIEQSQRYIEKPSFNDTKGNALFGSFWIFAGVVAALGSGAGGYAGDRRENAFGCLTMLAGLVAAGISYGLISKSDIKDYENRWNSKIEAATIEKNAALKKRVELEQDINFLDAQLEYKYSKKQAK